MNEISDAAPEAKIIAKILSDGQTQADRVITSAKRTAELEERKAQAEVERIRKEMLAQAERRADVFRSKEIAGARIEAKRILLRAREAAISKVVAVVEHELAGLKEKPDEYRRALFNLAAEAVSAVGEPEVTLRLGKDDEGLVDTGFAARVADRIKETEGSEVKIDVKYDSSLVGGGCVAVSRQGRVVFDNTFRRRLERMRPALRSMIAREVLKADV